MEHLSEEQLNEYLDGALEEQTYRKVASHLAECADCRAQLEDLKLVFTSLGDLPESPLARDLTPFIMLRLLPNLPVRVWTRAFAAQWGVVLGILFWLALQVIPVISISEFNFPVPSTLGFQTLITRLLTIQFELPTLRFPTLSYRLPQFDIQIPAISLQLSTIHVAALMIPAFLLWVVGNAILLRSRHENSQ
jgi:hypothetical protein